MHLQITSVINFFDPKSENSPPVLQGGLQSL